MRNANRAGTVRNSRQAPPNRSAARKRERERERERGRKGGEKVRAIDNRNLHNLVSPRHVTCRQVGKISVELIRTISLVDARDSRDDLSENSSIPEFRIPSAREFSLPPPSPPPSLSLSLSLYFLTARTAYRSLAAAPDSIFNKSPYVLSKEYNLGWETRRAFPRVSLPPPARPPARPGAS